MTATDKLKGVVVVERNGATLRIDDVPAEDMAEVLGNLLDAFRLLSRVYPEVVPILETVPGGTPTEVVDDDWADEGRRRRVGF